MVILLVGIVIGGLVGAVALCLLGALIGVDTVGPVAGGCFAAMQSAGMMGVYGVGACLSCI